VTFSTAILASRLKELEAKAAKPKRYVIAFSGGLDSTVLAHALANLKHHDDYSGIPVLAVHIDHGLQAESADWGLRCRDAAAEFEIDFRSLVVNVQMESGKGPEASARDARYSALHAEIGKGDWLLSAHHREDQAETLLLNLIRGRGPAGVAGIGSLRRFGPGWLVRPLLNVDRADLQQYALDESLLWVDDPSNSNRRFDRNFLRHEVLPGLKSRWPDIAARLQRSAGHAGEASQLLVELAEIDVQALGGDTARLPIDALSALSAGRQRNVIRYAIRDRGFPTPTALQLERIMKEVIRARVDAQPLVNWPGVSVRRYRNGLYLLPQNLADRVECRELEGTELELGSGLGVLRFESGDDLGLSKALLDGGLTIKPRVGGERFSPYGQTHTRELKKLLQEEGVVPWMRDRLPLVYSGDRLLAVGDLWLAADAVTKPGIAIRWSDRPALH